MKKKVFRFSWRTLILASLILLVNNTSFSQTWPSPGAKWTYCLTGWNGMPAGEELFGVTGDTLISGKLYNIIQPINPTKKNLVDNNDLVRTLYTRFENDTFYRYVNNQEYLFFTYNLSVGDVFSTFRTAGLNSYWEDSACSSVLPLRVIEESEVELNGQMLKEFVLEDTLFRHLYDPNYPDPVTYTLIERIGIVDNYLLINTLEPFADCFLPTDYGLAAVGKYTDDSFEYLFYECQGVGINNNQIPNSDIEIFPNPANQYLHVVQKSDPPIRFTISLLTEFGKLFFITEMDGKSSTIDLSGYQSGYYILVLTPLDSSKNRTLKPIIISH